MSFVLMSGRDLEFYRIGVKGKQSLVKLTRQVTGILVFQGCFSGCLELQPERDLYFDFSFSPAYPLVAGIYFYPDRITRLFRSSSFARVHLARYRHGSSWRCESRQGVPFHH